MDSEIRRFIEDNGCVTVLANIAGWIESGDDAWDQVDAEYAAIEAKRVINALSSKTAS